MSVSVGQVQDGLLHVRDSLPDVCWHLQLFVAMLWCTLDSEIIVYSNEIKGGGQLLPGAADEGTQNRLTRTV